MLLDGTQATSSRLVTPSDTENLDTQYRGFYVGTAGAVRFLGVDGVEDTWTNVAAGMIHAMAVIRIFSNGTSALDIHVVR